jgi:hypothetical protein
MRLLSRESLPYSGGWSDTARPKGKRQWMFYPRMSQISSLVAGSSGSNREELPIYVLRNFKSRK